MAVEVEVLTQLPVFLYGAVLVDKMPQEPHPAVAVAHQLWLTQTVLPVAQVELS